MLLREHPAPRRAEQVDPLQPELLPHGRDLVTEDGDAPFDVLRPVRLPAADLVVENDGPLRGESFERPEVVVRRARTPMERKQRRDRGIEVADDAIPGAVPAEVDVPLARRHRGYHPRTRPLSSVGRAPPW